MMVSFVLFVAVSAIATEAGENAFQKAAAVVVVLEVDTPSAGDPPASFSATGVFVALEGERTVLLASSRALRHADPSAMLVRQGTTLIRRPVNLLARDFSTDLVAVGSPWTPPHVVRVSESVAPELGRKLYCVSVDHLGRLLLAELIVCESDIRFHGILRYERLTRVSAGVPRLPLGAAVFDEHGDLFGFVVHTDSPDPLAPAHHYVNPVRAWFGCVNTLAEGRTVTRPWLGVVLSQERDASSQDAGARVVKVLPEGPAARADIEPDDVIVACEDTDGTYDIATVTDLTFRVADMAPDTKLLLHFRRHGALLKAELLLQALPLARLDEMRTADPVLQPEPSP